MLVEKKDLLYGSHSYHTGIVIKAVDEFILSPFNRSGLYAYDMERDMGIEPTYPAWKAGALADILIPQGQEVFGREPPKL